MFFKTVAILHASIRTCVSLPLEFMLGILGGGGEGAKIHLAHIWHASFCIYFLISHIRIIKIPLMSPFVFQQIFIPSTEGIPFKVFVCQDKIISA